jgi:hypothetical protein
MSPRSGASDLQFGRTDDVAALATDDHGGMEFRWLSPLWRWLSPPWP